MRKQSTVLYLVAAAGLVSLAACASSPGTSDSYGAGANGPDQATAALGTANVAVYSNQNFRAEAQQAPNTSEGFSGGSQPSAPAPLWTGTENWPPGSNGPMPPGSPSNGSDMGQAGD